MKRIIALILLLVFCLTLCACGSGSINDEEKDENSYYSWVGRFDLEKIELFENVFVKKDFPSLNMHTNQHITLNKGGSGKLAISCYTDDLPLETLDIEYEYDMTYQSGYIFMDGSSERIRFTLRNGVLVFEALGATWTFKKQK